MQAPTAVLVLAAVIACRKVHVLAVPVSDNVLTVIVFAKAIGEVPKHSAKIAKIPHRKNDRGLGSIDLCPGAAFESARPLASLEERLPDVMESGIANNLGAFWFNASPTSLPPPSAATLL